MTTTHERDDRTGRSHNDHTEVYDCYLAGKVGFGLGDQEWSIQAGRVEEFAFPLGECPRLRVRLRSRAAAYQRNRSSTHPCIDVALRVQLLLLALEGSTAAQSGLCCVLGHVHCLCRAIPCIQRLQNDMQVAATDEHAGDVAPLT